MDLLLHNAHVLTMDPARPTAQAVAIKDGRIAAVGGAELAATAATEVIDCEGATVMPGLNDTHNHQLRTGMNWTKVQLYDCPDVAAIQGALRRRAAETPAGQWVVASGRWHETRIAEGRLPTRAELDAACPDHPVWLARGGHVVVVNSLALQLGGISEDTPEPPGGSFGRDGAGRLDGLLLEGPAFAPVARLLPKPSQQDRLDGLRQAMAAYNAVGITSVRDPGLHPADLRAYQDLWAAGELTVRTAAMVWVLQEQPWPAIEQQLLNLPMRTGFGDDWLRLDGLKLLLDGGIEGAWLKEPYAYPGGAFHGHPLIEREKLVRTCKLAAQLGFGVGTHVAGDATMDMLLDAYEAANAEAPIAPLRWVIEHAFFANPDTAERIRRLGVLVTVQPNLMYALAGNMVRYWGRERTDRVLPIRHYLDSGLVLGGGSDSDITPHSPWLGIWSAVTRNSERAGVVAPQEAITREEALRLYTTGSAAITGQQGVKGALRPGMLADLIVVADDPLTCSEERLRDMQVLRTVVGGRTVYRA